MGKHTYRWWDGDVYRQATFTTKADKADFVTEVRRRRRLGLSLSFEPEEHDPRLDEFIEDYWRLHAIPHLGHATRRTYEQEWVKWILPRLGSYRLRQLSARMIVRQLVEPMRRAGAGAGEQTVRTTLAVLQSILAFALTEERVPENVVRKVRKPRPDVAREVPAIAPAQVEQLRALLAYEGLRPESYWRSTSSITSALVACRCGARSSATASLTATGLQKSSRIRRRAATGSCPGRHRRSAATCATT